jgi:membrane-anchored protein YejM (alkaline phosphatase superfamily)
MPLREGAQMYKLITILAAAIPVILFVKTVFFGRSKVMREASSAFRRQVDYLVWAIVFLVACALLYSVGSLIYPLWK